MIQLRSILRTADNTGAKGLMVIHVYGGSQHRIGHLGDVVNVVVTDAEPNGMVKDKEKVQAIVVRTKKEFRRQDGSYIRFDDNAAVVIDKEGNPRGTRIFGPVPREIKEAGYAKIASLAAEVI